MYLDSSKISFEIVFLYVTAECKYKHGKKISAFVAL